MALSHIRSGEPADVHPLGNRLAQERSAALFKSDQLEVIRLVLLAGKSMPPHKVQGEITIQCIEGKLEIAAGGTSRVLDAGQLLFLAADVVHDVVALEDASALVTIVVRK